MRTIPWMCMMAAMTLAAFAACSDSPDASPSNAPPTSDAGELPQTDASSVRDAAVVDASDAAAGGDTFSYCNGKNGPTLTFSPGQEQSVLDAINQLAECSTVRLGPGTFHFQNALTLRQKGVTLAGAGKGIKGALVGDATSTVLDFTTAAANTNGVDHVGDWVTVEGLALINAKKDALRIEASTNVRVRFVRAEWATENATDNGKYGIYPVKSTNVLIEDSEAYNAADAGIYVGQTTNAIIRRNTAKQNVAGIEIENTKNADVSKNVAEDNTCGLVVFDLPGNPTAGTDIKVFDNTVRNNNRNNFGASVVGQVPAGTGTFVMASRRVELTGNAYANNNTADVAIISGLSLEPDTTAWTAGGQNWGVADIWVHGNTMGDGSGDSVDNGTPDSVHRPLGALLAGLYAYAAATQGVTRVEPFVWDGVDLTGADNMLVDDVNVCIGNNTLPAGMTNAIVDLNLPGAQPLLGASTPDVAGAWAKTSHVAQGAAPFQCAGFSPALTTVTLPQ